MTRSLLALAIVAAFLVTAPAASAQDPRMWQAPSKNISCATFGKFLRCDMRQLGNPAPPTPASCEFDYGSAFGVNRKSKKGRRLCVSDAVSDPDAPVLPYGTIWRRNGFRCTIRETGVTCTNARGHGFSLRRGRQSLF